MVGPYAIEAESALRGRGRHEGGQMPGRKLGVAALIRPGALRIGRTQPTERPLRDGDRPSGPGAPVAAGAMAMDQQSAIMRMCMDH